MRKIFADTYIQLFAKKKSSIFLTGDLGFMALEGVQKAMKKRFINAGVAEQNMVSVAAGMAAGGLIPFVYSIAPFITLKTNEQVRNDIGFTRLPVTCVGNGGGYGYGIMGPTHHILEDLAFFSTMPHFTSYIPSFDEDLNPQMKKIQQKKGPAYLRLGLAKKHSLTLPVYAPIRHLKKGKGQVVFVLGPLIHEVLAIKEVDKKVYSSLDIWNVSELPATLSSAALASCKKNKNIVIIEEHVQLGGLGSHITEQLLTHNIHLESYKHIFARGYPTGTYGTQAFHRGTSGLDTIGIINTLKNEQ